jgi:hypothetical protein
MQPEGRREPAQQQRVRRTTVEHQCDLGFRDGRPFGQPAGI